MRDSRKLPILLVLLIVISCRSPSSPLRDSTVEIRRDPDSLVSPCGRYGYAVVVKEPMRGVLTIERTGEEPTLLEWEYNPGEKAVFGYTLVTFKTSSGLEEHKFCAQLRYVRHNVGKNQSGESSGGKCCEFFLDEPIARQSGRLQENLPFGETLAFASMTCGRNGERIDLSIQFERLSSANITSEDCLFYTPVQE